MTVHRGTDMSFLDKIYTCPSVPLPETRTETEGGTREKKKKKEIEGTSASPCGASPESSSYHSVPNRPFLYVSRLQPFEWMKRRTRRKHNGRCGAARG